MAKVKQHTVEATVADAVSSAFSEIESIKDELREWYDNLPENFQNGSKGEALQEAISALEGASEVNAPDCIEGAGTSYAEYHGRIGRPKRRDTCVNMLDAAISTAQERADELGALEYSDEGRLLGDDGEPTPDDVTDTEERPLDAEDRDSMVSDLETFISECEDAKGEWENVEFPGMFG